MDCRIERIEIASFGRLSDVSLDLSEGINLLSAPNESGKSTLAAFLRFALYGFTDGKKQTLAENDRRLYTPWETPRAEGTLFLRRGEKLFKIFRSCSGTKEQLAVTDALTGKPVQASPTPGASLLGVSEEVFSRTLFFRQLAPPQNRDGVLAEQLQNLAVSADEQISSASAIERLTKAKNALRGRAGAGLLPELEKEKLRFERELSDAEEDLATLNMLRTEAKKAGERLEENRACRAKVASEKDGLERLEAKTTLLHLRILKEEADRAQEAYESASAEVQTHGEQDGAFLASLLSKNASLQALTEKKERTDALLEQESAALAAEGSGMTPEQADAAEKTRKKQSGLRDLCLFAGFAACFAGMFLLYFGQNAAAVCSFVFSIALLIGAFLFRKRLGKLYASFGAKDKAGFASLVRSAPAKEALRQEARKRVEALRGERDGLESEEKSLRDSIEEGIRSYRAEPGEDYDAQLQNLMAACARLTELQAKSRSALQAYESASAGLDLPLLASLAENAPAETRDRRLIERDETFYRQQGEVFSDKKQNTELQIAALEARVPDCALLESRKTAAEERIAEYGAKYASLEAARAGIEEAADRMKSMVAPRISELAGTYFSESTGGRYDALGVDTRLAMNTEDGGMTRDCDYLSAGTRDCAYLSLRLALADLLFGGGGVPMVLDDAFGRLDDLRLASALKLLAACAERHQFLLLTCTDREGNALKAAGTPFRRLSPDVLCGNRTDL